MNEHIIRWIQASLAVHLRDQLTIPVFLQDQDAPSGDKVILHLDVIATQKTKTEYEYEVATSVILYTVTDPKDLYKRTRLEGLILKAFDTTLIIKKYGGEGEDDGSTYGCLVPRTPVKVSPYPREQDEQVSVVTTTYQIEE